MSDHAITIIGSVNLDLVVRAKTLPTPGETVIGATLARYPGGKGANQALAAQRLGARTRLVARVGNDAFATEALALLTAEGVDVTRCDIDQAAPTGVAFIAVSDAGENQIVVASGANMTLAPHHLPVALAEAVICQLEVPMATIAHAVSVAQGFVCLNLAPAQAIAAEVLARADLIVVNELEAAFYGDQLHQGGGLVAITLGSRGADLYRRGALIATALPPTITPVDTTGAGDAFTAALTLAIIEGQGSQEALDFACCVGALTATKPGAQSALPHRVEVEAFRAKLTLPKG